MFDVLVESFILTDFGIRRCSSTSNIISNMGKEEEAVDGYKNLGVFHHRLGNWIGPGLLFSLPASAS